MRVHVAFTPAEAATASVGIVVDVLRATSTIAQALASGYQRVICCSEVEEAHALRAKDGGVLAGERKCVLIPGFDLGNSPREFLDPRAETVILTTTNGTRALVTAASRSEIVFAGSLLNLGAVVSAARASGESVAILCAGVLGELALDDAYCAGRIARAPGRRADGRRRRRDAHRRSFADPRDGLASSQSARNLVAAGLDADVDWCARESVLDVVPRLRRCEGGSRDRRLRTDAGGGHPP